MTVLTELLDRTIVIRAKPDLVFRYFTDSARWAAWWGQGSSIDARRGGAMKIRYPDGTEAVGEVVDVEPPSRIVFTYGYASGTLIPPGGSRVTIEVEPHRDGTLVTLQHQFADAPTRDQHVQGWRYQLSLFSNVVVNELHANAAELVDAWFAAWATTDDDERKRMLRNIVAANVTFRDPYSTVDGLDELHAQIGGAIRFMRGVRLHRAGTVRHCQGTVLSDWTATGMGPDGQAQATGTNVFVLGADGLITSAVGIWNR
ncbi:MAG TPA: SRPBCC domain-containing protein [Vicinamibacterales bacterium]|nr:SRPBCC domain-containing protein [Vicinamibacterales bacterium]